MKELTEMTWDELDQFGRLNTIQIEVVEVRIKQMQAHLDRLVAEKDRINRQKRVLLDKAEPEAG